MDSIKNYNNQVLLLSKNDAQKFDLPPIAKRLRRSLSSAKPMTATQDKVSKYWLSWTGL